MTDAPQAALPLPAHADIEAMRDVLTEFLESVGYMEGARDPHEATYAWGLLLYDFARLCGDFKRMSRALREQIDLGAFKWRMEWSSPGEVDPAPVVEEGAPALRHMLQQWEEVERKVGEVIEEGYQEYYGGRWETDEDSEEDALVVLAELLWGAPYVPEYRHD